MTEEPKAESVVTAPAPSDSSVKEDAMKIYFSNGSYKTIRVNGNHTAGQLAMMMAEKIHMGEFGHYFEVVEIKKDQRTIFFFFENLRRLVTTFNREKSWIW